MRVVHVTPYCVSDRVGGVETHVYELSKQMLRLGFAVAVYTCSKSPRKIEGVEIRSFPSFCPVPETKIGKYVFARRLDNPCPSPSFISELTREKTDVIHLHGQEFVTSLLGFLAAKSAGVPCVLTIHSNGKAFEHVWLVRLLRRILYKSFFRTMVDFSDAVIVPTKEALQLIRRYGLKPRRIVHIPHAVELERFQGIEQGGDYVLYVGRLNPVKGPEFLVKAAPLILEEADTRIVFAGDGHQRPYLEKLADDLGLSSRISFLGMVPYEKIPQIMGRASVLVAPGNAGLSLLEAGALGKPIVSVDSQWNVSCIGKEGAYYVEPRNERRLAEAVVRLLKDQSLSKEIAARSMSFVRQRRNWGVIIEKYVELYESLKKTVS